MSFLENKSNTMRQMALKIISYLLILAEIESSQIESIEMDKIKLKFVGLKSVMKESIQTSISKLSPSTKINLKDDIVENIKERKKGTSLKTSSAPQEALSIFEEIEMFTALPKAEPIPEDIIELDYVKGILKICSVELANCILSQDWKMRKSALLLICKQSK